MRIFGLVGFPLSHSFSEKYFSKKFEQEKIFDSQFRNFSIERIEEVEKIFEIPELTGLSITIPYKQSVIPYLDEIDESAREVGAVNSISIRNELGKIKEKIGFNTDAYGFENSLLKFFANAQISKSELQKIKALVLGTGGASKAVAFVLKKLEIDFTFVSRTRKAGVITYTDLKPQIILEHKLIVNTTPLGMFPDISVAPDIPYSFITSENLLYDLTYNPAETEFLKRGKLQGAQVKNGLEMLQLQAEKSWEIWNS